jgi:hypothetical protein
MIQDLDETIRQILIKKGKLNGGDIDISFDQPTGEWAGGLTRPTINGYLYDIRENVELRNRQWTVERQGNNTKRVLEPLRIDVSYLFTVWTRNIEDEHRLLWRVLQTLATQGSIPIKETVGAMTNQPYPLRTKVALPSESIHNLPDLWGVMENQLRPAINYVVTVSLDLGLEIEAPMVLSGQFKLGEYDGEERRLRTNGNGHPEVVVIDDIFHVGGQVLSNGQPVSGAQVMIQDHPFAVTSDPNGRYVFANIPAGEYTFQVQLGDQAPLLYPVRIPSDRVDGYDLALGGTSGNPKQSASPTKSTR